MENRIKITYSNWPEITDPKLELFFNSIANTKATRVNFLDILKNLYFYRDSLSLIKFEIFKNYMLIGEYHDAYAGDCYVLIEHNLNLNTGRHSKLVTKEFSDENLKFLCNINDLYVKYLLGNKKPKDLIKIKHLYSDEEIQKYLDFVKISELEEKEYMLRNRWYRFLIYEKEISNKELSLVKKIAYGIMIYIIVYSSLQIILNFIIELIYGTKS